MDCHLDGKGESLLVVCLALHCVALRGREREREGEAKRERGYSGELEFLGWSGEHILLPFVSTETLDPYHDDYPGHWSCSFSFPFSFCFFFLLPFWFYICTANAHTITWFLVILFFLCGSFARRFVDCKGLVKYPVS